MPGYHTLIVEPDDGRTAVLAALGSARSTIDLTIYELSDAQILAALIAAKQRGVVVQVLYNWYSFSARTQQTDVTPYINQLVAQGIACRIAPKAFEVTHEKAFVIDGSTAIIMTFNLTSDYFGQTRDFGVVTTDPAEVAEVAAVFSADWNDQPAAPTAPSLLWSPVNSRAKLTALINGATATLDLYCEEIEDPGTLAAVVAAARRGVAVRFIAAVLQSAGKVNGNAQGITYLRAGGVNAVCKNTPYMHAKMALADRGTADAQAYIGSENLTCVSLNDNRECGILVTDAAILERLETVFSTDWALPSVTVVPDPTPLQPCAGEPQTRAGIRVRQREAALAAAAPPTA